MRNLKKYEHFLNIFMKKCRLQLIKGSYEKKHPMIFRKITYISQYWIRKILFMFLDINIQFVDVTSSDARKMLM